ncbi:hypothetical protein [Rhizobium sp. LjRoot258]|uniref:hypothetical protein n=1 Tax=Rhizobium sp. LjRoot258 TaxID=3342299 RepID=UPI003ECE4BEF
MEKRLVRAERRYDPNQSVFHQLTVIRAEVRRCLSKVDSLRPADIKALEQQIELLQISDDRFSLANLIAGLKIGLNQMEPEDVLETLPGQKPAAFQFGFDGDRIIVVDQPLRVRDRDKDIAAAALEAATEKGVYVGEHLALSNCSPRLRDAFRAL